MSVRKLGLLVVTIFLSVSCFAVHPLKPHIARKASASSWRPLPKTRQFRKPVTHVENKHVSKLPTFNPDRTFLSKSEASDWLVSRHSQQLHKKLADGLKDFKGKNVYFSGYFVPSLEELWKAGESFTLEEFAQSAEQAVQTMLDEIANFQEGYAVVKVIQKKVIQKEGVNEELAEPCQTILVMDPQTSSWTVFSEKITPTVIPAVPHEGYLSLATEQGQEYLFIPMNDPQSIGQEGVIISDTSTIENIRAASEVYSQRMSGKEPFYVRIVAYGDPIEPALGVDPRITSVYHNYRVEYASEADGPFFSSMAEVKEYLSEKEDRRRFLERDNQVTGTMQSSTTRYRVANDDDISYRFYKTFQEAEAAVQQQSLEAREQRLHRYPSPMQDSTNMQITTPAPTTERTSSVVPQYRDESGPYVPVDPAHEVNKPSTPVVLDPNPNAPIPSKTSKRRKNRNPTGEIPTSFENGSIPGTFRVGATGLENSSSPVVLEPDPNVSIPQKSKRRKEKSGNYPLLPSGRRFPPSFRQDVIGHVDYLNPR